jgi:L-lactate dehydrogenase complex protein LldE
MQIALMITCLGDVLRPAAGKATVHVLRRLGHEIDFPTAQTCCGQPMYNSGFAELARRQAQHTIGVFEAAETIVTPSGSCAAMVKVEYPHLFEHDPAWLKRSQDLAAKTFEFSDFLVNRLGVVDVGARYDGAVAYHFACHLRMLNQQDEVERLIQHVAGATLLPIERQDQCCGFGGSFAIRYPNISTTLVDAKMQAVLTTGASALVSTDAGCLMNIGGRLHREGQDIEVLHIAELLERC